MKKIISPFLLAILPLFCFAQGDDYCACNEIETGYVDLMDWTGGTTINVQVQEDLPLPPQDLVVTTNIEMSYEQVIYEQPSFQQLVQSKEKERPQIQEIITEELEEEEIIEDINEVEEDLEEALTDNASKQSRAMMKKRKKIKRVHIKKRKKARKYRGNCPAF